MYLLRLELCINYYVLMSQIGTIAKRESNLLFVFLSFLFIDFVLSCHSSDTLDPVNTYLYYYLYAYHVPLLLYLLFKDYVSFLIIIYPLVQFAQLSYVMSSNKVFSWFTDELCRLCNYLMIWLGIYSIILAICSTLSV